MINRGSEGEGEKEEDKTKLDALRTQIQKLRNDEGCWRSIRHNCKAYSSRWLMMKSARGEENGIYCGIHRLAYLSHLDIRSIPCLKDDTLLAVKAPYGSTLEVPDPDEV